MSKKSKTDNIIFFAAIVVILIALINLGITFYKFGGMNQLTGKVSDTDTGTANLTIASMASINFTTETINWGAGNVNNSEVASAYIDSEGNRQDGNWTTNNVGLIIQNNGNCNVQLNLTTSNTAATFLGGTTPLYKIKVTNASGEASCYAGLASAYATATGASQAGCNNFTYWDATDTLRIDVNITIPADATPGVKGSTITATGTVID